MLAAALLGGWKEAKEARIELKEEDPAIVARVLLFVYTENYPSTLVAPAQSQLAGIEDDYSNYSEDNIDMGQLVNLHLEMFAIATRLGIKDLCDTARGRFAATLGEWVCPESVDDPGCFFRLPGIVDIIKKVYTTTPEDHRQLRDVIAFHASLDKWSCSCSGDHYRGIAAFKEVPELLFDVFMGRFESGWGELSWRCPHCERDRHVWLPACHCEKRGRNCEMVVCQELYQDRLFCWVCGLAGDMVPPGVIMGH